MRTRRASSGALGGRSWPEYSPLVVERATIPVAELATVAAEFPALRFLVLHGSRARGDDHARSDWDFAYLADGPVDELALIGRLVDVVATERVDVVDLSRAGCVIRYKVAQHGKLLFERAPSAFDDFRLEAALYWLDMQDIIRAEQEARLQDLG